MAFFRAQNTLSQRTTSASGFSYDVFLSFRGEDTRKTFTDHLYTALVNAGFRTFRDDPELERGENIKKKLDKAIRHSQSSIIVFSKHYAASGWCLDELVMILERKKICSHVVLPVFYDVDPSQVRKQTGIVGTAFARHQKTQLLNKVKRWRAALREVADLAGMVLQNEADRHEAKFIQNIVEVIRVKIDHLPLSSVQEVLQSKLSSANHVLEDVEVKQLNNPFVKDWLIDLKEVVYDAEDLLQEIKTEALRRTRELESGSSTSKIQDHSSCFPFHTFDSALMKSRSEEVIERLDCFAKQRNDVLSLEATVRNSVSHTIPSTCLVEDSSVYGRNGEKETFVTLLLSDDVHGNKITVIPIVGMGGIGKTTVAQLVFNDVRVVHRFDLQAWASVSEDFDVFRITKSIYEAVIKKPCPILTLNEVQSELKTALMGKKFFLVLDDIWNKNYMKWDFLMRPLESGAHGSKIIVTTRNEDVASMVGSLLPCRLMQICEEDAWLLFEKHAFRNIDVVPRSGFEEIGRRIVQKCCGHPLAIKSLGGLLRSKSTVGEWKSILNSDLWDLSPDESDILPSLMLSYINLSPALKRCFAYCSIFPKNYRFQTSELVFLWMSGDLLQANDKNTAEEIGKEYFKELTSRSFFQLSSNIYHDQSIIMHDLINDLATSVSSEFCLRWDGTCDSPRILSKTRHLSYMIEYEYKGLSTSWTEDPCFIIHIYEDSSLRKFEALQQAKHLRTFIPLQQMDFDSRRSFTLLGKGLYEVLPLLQFLRLLNLSGYMIEELPDSINNLKLLKHLDMSRTLIKRLPDTICTLYNLQVLLLSNCPNLTELPINLARLINLTHLDIACTWRLKKLPSFMGNLKNLQMLSNFMLEKHSAVHNLLELKMLQNLRGKLKVTGLRNIVHGKKALKVYSMRDKKFLNELSLNWKGRHASDEGNDTARELLEKLQPHLNLERLKVSAYGGRSFPGWSGYYSSSALVDLKLDNCMNCSSLPPLGQLPFLRDLEVSNLDGVVSIGSEFYYGDNSTCLVNKPFRSLQSLKFYSMYGWQEWSHVDEGELPLFPNLRELSLSECPNLTGILVLDSFPMLKVLKLCSDNVSGVTSSQECPKLVSLTNLHIENCPNIRSLFNGAVHAPKLTEIYIRGCKNLISLPEQMHILLPSLESLSVWDCVELKSFPEEGLPSEIKSVTLSDCKKFNAKSMQNGVRRLTSLKSLKLDFSECAEDLESFPVEVLFPSTLQLLTICHLNLKTINGAKWFGHLKSLKCLEFESCSALQCLTDTGLLTSPFHLCIHDCPLLEKCGLVVNAKHCPRNKGACVIM